VSHLFYIKRGDQLPSVEATLREPAAPGQLGAAIDLTGASAVKFLCSNGVDAAAVIVDALGGQVRYDWGTNETDVDGTFDGEFEIAWGDGRKQTVPNGDYIKVIIAADLG
jgi:hypothetical protein